jgi:hypothetical protein
MPHTVLRVYYFGFIRTQSQPGQAVEDRATVGELADLRGEVRRRGHRRPRRAAGAVLP